MNPERLRKAPHIAIVGSSSPLGKELKEMIESSSFPAGKLSLVETEEYAGLLQEFAGEIQITQILSPEVLSDVDITFFTCSREIIDAYARSGNPFPDLTIDLTQTRSTGTLFLSGLSNPNLLQGARYIVNPHAATISICRILSQLQKDFAIEASSITVLQPASERGSSGVDELQQQTVSLLNFQQIESGIFGGQIAFNLLPEIASSRDTEAMLRSQIGALLPQLNPPPAIAVVQAPVFHSHCFSMFLTVKESPAVGELQERLGDSFGSIVVHRSEDVAASPVSVIGTDAVHVARLEGDPTPGRYFLWLVSDNLRIAAHNALQIAESIILAPAL